MATSSNVLVDNNDSGMLGAADLRIPADVRMRFDEYDRVVTSVVPVIGVSREEWWLFDDEGTLVDVLCRHA